MDFEEELESLGLERAKESLAWEARARITWRGKALAASGILLLWLLATVLLVTGVQRLLLRQRARDRVFASGEPETLPSEDDLGFLARWLFVAGFRSPLAPAWFIAVAVG